MSKTRLQELAEFGQSIWLDYIDRPLLETGKLQTMIKNGLRGMTSNPAIFNKAIGSSNDYDEEIVRLKEQGKSAFEIYDALTIKDIQAAADAFKGVYDATDGLDGYVSLEIDPRLANKTQESIDEGIRLFKAVGRPNTMIKVPATDAGFKVVEELIARGINVNTTLIFSFNQYVKTAKAYIRGIERLSKNTDVSKVRSVASVFVSRIEVAVDELIDQAIKVQSDETSSNKIKSLKGASAVSNSRVIFEEYKNLFEGQAFAELKNKGAHSQRILWASTATKNPDYSDVKYVTELIANPSVNTLPEKTLNAFEDHGQVAAALTNDVNEAKDVISSLKGFGIDLDQICLKLLEQGVVLFEEAFDELLNSIEKKAQQLCAK